MKYYMSKYWEMMNSDDPDMRDKGDIGWIENTERYMSYFDTIKENLPKGFLRIFDKNDWFHDFSIENIEIMNTGKYSSIIKFIINRGNILYELTFKGVKSFFVNIPTTQNWMCGILTWGYTEFEMNDEKSWIIRILCDFDCELEILFKHISVKKVVQEKKE